jgi:hypothetical protein
LDDWGSHSVVLDPSGDLLVGSSAKAILLRRNTGNSVNLRIAGYAGIDFPKTTGAFFRTNRGAMHPCWSFLAFGVKRRLALEGLQMNPAAKNE